MSVISQSLRLLKRFYIVLASALAVKMLPSQCASHEYAAANNQVEQICKNWIASRRFLALIHSFFGLGSPLKSNARPCSLSFLKFFATEQCR